MEVENLSLLQAKLSALEKENQELKNQLEEAQNSINNTSETLLRIADYNERIKTENQLLKEGHLDAAQLQNELREHKVKLREMTTILSKRVGQKDDGKKPEPKHYPAGTVLFQQGDKSDGFFILIKGHVGIFLDGHQVNDICGENKYFGEMIIIGETHRTATAKVLDDSQLLCIPLNSFVDVIKKTPSLLLDLLIGNTTRLAAQTTERTKAQGKLHRLEAFCRKHLPPPALLELEKILN